MKPTFQTNGARTRECAHKVPITDFNYHSIVLSECSGRCAGVVTPSFHTLSRDYFKTEARQYSLAETVVFAAIMATAVLPILNGASAVMD
jgi:hypothetical protein